jgi:hypothetical protein
MDMSLTYMGLHPSSEDKTQHIKYLYNYIIKTIHMFNIKTLTLMTSFLPLYRPRLIPNITVIQIQVNADESALR